MEIPEGAKPSVFESKFILEKDGKKQEFTLDNYPDSTWTFVETRTVLKEKGYEPPIHDFSIVSLETGEDLTDSILSDKGYTFLLVAHRIENADDSNIDLINEIYDYSVEHGYGFYALTSSPEEQIELWRDKTGAEYPFCQMDDITLKTIHKQKMFMAERIFCTGLVTPQLYLFLRRRSQGIKAVTMFHTIIIDLVNKVYIAIVSIFNTMSY